MAEEVKQMVELLINTVQDGIEKQDPTILGVLVAVAVVFITLVVFLFTKRTNRQRGVLLCGICDAGKTLIFSRLVQKTTDDRMTVTSIKPNTGDYAVQSKNKSLQLIDLPGHERVRVQMLEQYKSSVRGIVFVIDSGTVMKEMKEVAEYLYTILSDGAVLGNTLPVLVACNKADLTLKKGKDIIKKNLASEMNTLRKTRSAALQQLEGSANNNTFLGKRDKDFSFEDLKPLKVDFVECSALVGEIDLTAVENWLIKIA